MNFTLPELAQAVNDWCSSHHLVPANGQASEQLNVRALRYYRHLGLLDAPEDGTGAGYSEKHLLQLQAIRLLQGTGLPLGRIQQLLYGRPVAELRKIVKRGLTEISTAPSSPALPLASAEAWRLYPLDNDFILIARNADQPTPEQIDAIRAILNQQQCSNRK